MFKKLQNLANGQCNISEDRQLIRDWCIFIWLSRFIWKQELKLN